MKPRNDEFNARTHRIHQARTGIHLHAKRKTNPAPSARLLAVIVEDINLINHKLILEKNRIRIVIIALFTIVFLVWAVIPMFQPTPEYMKFKNKVSFEGIVTDSYRNVELHGFGIVRFKIVKSNTKTFNAFQNGKIYPYNIKDADGEIYDYVPYNLKEGDKIYVNSKNAELSYYKNNKLLSKANLLLIKEESWIEFIKKETRLNN